MIVVLQWCEKKFLINKRKVVELFHSADVRIAFC